MSSHVSRSRSRSPTSGPSDAPSSPSASPCFGDVGHSEGASTPKASPDRVVSPRASHQSSPSTSRHTMGNEMVIADTPWSTELTSPPTARATVANLQLRITEMASSQRKLQDAHDRQVQTTLNNEYSLLAPRTSCYVKPLPHGHETAHAASNS